MADVFPAILLIAFLFHNSTSYRIDYSKLPEVNGESQRAHLSLPHVVNICASRDMMCRSNDSVVCTTRLVNGSFVYRDFENPCFLFMSNMCDHPGEEYNIIEDVLCETHLARRNHRRNDATNTTAVNATNTTTAHNVKNTTPAHNSLNTTDFGNGTEYSTVPILRAGIYDLEEAFDSHPCPLSCPQIYSPVCVSANRGQGKYFKYYTFVNHCEGDLYYCKHYEEFGPPGSDDEEDVDVSGLGWSFCGAFRYLQFARFSEVLSSMGHYGWLVGNQRYSAIQDHS